MARKDPYESTKPMTRAEVSVHARTVADHIMSEIFSGLSHRPLLRERLLNMIELAMCRAAGVSWAKLDGGNDAR